ncbi:MAG TPA: prephenate dehydrogenase/arogenate dehydrogenase family protein [Thermoanaerobaculia bacterium]|nr:prephenate dehydrogenase/arogenate dehydrogenase family protein [Thermoanaerobaculia bacterium]
MTAPESSDPTDLSTLRDTIARVDRGILELLRRRMAIAAEIGRIKAGDGLPVTVKNVEERVLARARQHAEACGISEKVMEEIFRDILRASVERQHREGIALRELAGERILLVGGAGGMGTWLSGFLALGGHAIDLLDPSFVPLPANTEAPGRFGGLDEISNLDVYAAIFVAVPLGSTAAVIEEIAARRPRGLVIEIASIKDPLQGSFDTARAAGVRTLSLHPMFGPSKSLYEPLTFVLAARGDLDEERALIQPLLNHPYTKLVVVPFLHHDRLMGWLLGLAHLSNLAFGAALTRSGITARELYDCASTTFSRQASTALSVLSEDPDLYLDIQRLNPHRTAVYAAARDAIDELEHLVEVRDREGFRATLEAARAALERNE